MWGIIFVLFFGVHLPASSTTITPHSISRAEYILKKVGEADAICSQVQLQATVETEVENGVKVKHITERQIALCAWSEETASWHVIHIALKYPVSEEYTSCVRVSATLEERKNCVLSYRVVTPGYQLEHQRGYGITRLIFNAYKEKTISVHDDKKILSMTVRGEKLVVYRTRHMWFDDDALTAGDVDHILATATAINYTPDHPDFADDELAIIGKRYLIDKLRIVEQTLGVDVALSGTVRSHAFSDRALAKIIPRETLMALAIIEQIDDLAYLSDKEGEVQSKLREYAINRDKAFAWSQSWAASGPLQFTPRTYDFIVLGYPQANIEPNFDIGARSLTNVLAAAYALLDYNIAHFPEIQPIFKKDSKRGALFPVADYNGGPPASRALYAWLKKNRISVLRKHIVLPRSFAIKKTEQCPCRSSVGKVTKKTGAKIHYVANTETPMYLTKYLYLLEYLAEHELD
ncbi:MAG: hypothetical protein UY04_C0036G0012 [Parcubacteria group bacterium GW2011_GWA2_47_7]|nr:MAG: hypothetical protein UY04_C0036G0012 [Parcubacteria group bacterium GW2011_GWA2_47_7]